MPETAGFHRPEAKPCAAICKIVGWPMRKPGPQPKPPSQLRTARFTILLTPEEAKDAVIRQTQSGLKKTDWWRMKVLAP
jgi:hypothetical protein